MSQYVRIKQRGDYVSPLAKAVDESLEKAVSSDYLPFHITNMSGMSGKRYRTFINTLVSKIPDARYLEIGSWAGSTSCSAMYDNSLTITCIDNWSEFGGPKKEFYKNTKKCLSDTIDFTFIEEDFNLVDYTSLGTFNIYLYDGPHEQEDQYKGVRIAKPALDNEFILIVDDFNWDKVRKGTYDAIADEKYTVISSIEIRTTEDNTHPPQQFAGERGDWHNGYYIAVLKK
jgi:predicted O-methyltransferase YrrM